MASAPAPGSAGSITWSDYTASWVAVFILLLLWWISYAVAAFRSPHRRKNADTAIDVPPEANNDDDGIHDIHSDHSDANRRHRKISGHLRNGMLFLLTSVIITFALGAPHSMCNSLAWIFTGLWVLIAMGLWLADWPRAFPILKFLTLGLVVAIISNAFAHDMNIVTSAPR